MGCRIFAILPLLLAACASQPTMPDIAGDVILLGEQHDAPSHQVLHRQAIESLIARQMLAAVALEMAEQGRSTSGLPRDAGEAAVKDALAWNEDSWPWQPYAPAVMTAVRAGVPVAGANLPRSSMRSAMAEAQLDAQVPPPVLEQQRQAVRDGHCGVLPESQVAPMTRVQIARDRAMAQTLAQWASPGKNVVLLAGGAHVDPALGVPLHLPASLRVHVQRWLEQPPAQDYCAQLRERFKR
ncbi:MAG: ChaN family lipoprotein [Ramlibacter sp.]